MMIILLILATVSARGWPVSATVQSGSETALPAGDAFESNYYRNSLVNCLLIISHDQCDLFLPSSDSVNHKS
jgi:hypothetical protein